MTYVRRPSKVDVFHYTRQPREDWPEWLQAHGGYNDVSGAVKVAVDPVGILLIPTGNSFQRAEPGDFVVREEIGELVTVSAYRQREFDSLYTEE